ncbi:MAG: YihY/virulence factor BrkB family protein [Terracidiphilus sp.]
MASVSNPGTLGGTIVESAGVIDVVEPATKSKWYRWRKDGTALIQYLLDSEVHTFAFSVAANAILSFLPFVVLLYTLSWKVFRSASMAASVTEVAKYFIPSPNDDPDFVVRLLQKAAVHQSVQAFSLIMILVACTGIFLPLEVALNQAWGVVKSRNYLSNQVVAFGLAILMVILGVTAIVINAVATTVLTDIFFSHVDNIIFKALDWMVLAISTGVACIVFLFAIYWLLPNRKVPWRPVMKTATVTGVIWLVAKFFFVALLPHLHLGDLYGGFQVSVGLIFWAYTSGLILFAGAQFSVAKMGDRVKA